MLFTILNGPLYVCVCFFFFCSVSAYVFAGHFVFASVERLLFSVFIFPATSNGVRIDCREEEEGGYKKENIEKRGTRRRRTLGDSFRGRKDH